MTDLSAAAIGLLARGGRSIVVRLSGISMGRTIPDGAMVRVEPVDIEAARRGDVLAFSDGDRVVAHRVRFRARDHFVMLGDGYIVPDLPVPASTILGRIAQWNDGGEWRAVQPRRKPTLTGAILVFAVSAALLVSPWLARKIAAAAGLFRRQSPRSQVRRA